MPERNGQRLLSRPKNRNLPGKKGVPQPSPLLTPENGSGQPFSEFVLVYCVCFKDSNYDRIRRYPPYNKFCFNEVLSYCIDNLAHCFALRNDLG